MLDKTTVQFLKNLKKNNNKPWFDENRKTYEAAKQDFLNLVTQVLNEIKAFDETFVDIEPKQCMFRINRDVRFSKDKSPYKTNFGASFSKDGKKIQRAGYYFHIEPGACFMGGGLYMPMADMLGKIRQEIDYNFDGWKSIVNKASFKKVYSKVDGVDVLSRPPKGYDAENPAIEFLKMKSFIAMAPVPDELLTDKKLVKQIVTAFKELKPMIDFLNHGME